MNGASLPKAVYRNFPQLEIESTSFSGIPAIDGSKAGDSGRSHSGDRQVTAKSSKDYQGITSLEYCQDIPKILKDIKINAPNHSNLDDSGHFLDHKKN